MEVAYSSEIFSPRVGCQSDLKSGIPLLENDRHMELEGDAGLFVCAMHADVFASVCARISCPFVCPSLCVSLFLASLCRCLLLSLQGPSLNPSKKAAIAHHS